MKFALPLALLLTLGSVAYSQDSDQSPADSAQKTDSKTGKDTSESQATGATPGKKSDETDASSNEASASSNDAKKAKKPPAKPNYNLDLMGEFVGEVQSGGKDAEVMALQLRPIGSGQFDGLSYRGGLPGQDGCELEAVTRYLGKRNENVLILSGGKQAIFVRKDGCQIVDQNGNTAGKLKRVVRKSPTEGAVAPDGAIVIFDGSDVENLMPGELTNAGTLRRGATIGPMAQDFDLHVEFKFPIMADQLDQKRGNSGVYLQSRYECQVLDSFATTPVFNSAGAIYRYRAADVCASLPPTQWQTYDIRFTAPRWNAKGEKTRNARISSWYNGIVVQDDIEVTAKTGHGSEEEPKLLPTKLQDHSDAVEFRNVWMIDRGLSPGIEFPILVDGTASDDESDASENQNPTVPVATETPVDSSTKDEPAKEGNPTDVKADSAA